MSNKEKGLMSKTKAQLVDIIIRKDDEETRLKETMAFQDQAISKLKKSLEASNRNVEQHQSGMDELTSQKVAAEEAANNFKRQRNAARAWNWILAIAVITVSILWIIL